MSTGWKIASKNDHTFLVFGAIVVSRFPPAKTVSTLSWLGPIVIGRSGQQICQQEVIKIVINIRFMAEETASLERMKFWRSRKKIIIHAQLTLSLNRKNYLKAYHTCNTLAHEFWKCTFDLNPDFVKTSFRVFFSKYVLWA